MKSKLRQPPPEVVPEKPKPCFYCNGSLKVKTLFSGFVECGSCHGTGIDMEDKDAALAYLTYHVKKTKRGYFELFDRFKAYREEMAQLFSEDEVKRRRDSLFAEKHSSRFD